MATKAILQRAVEALDHLFIHDSADALLFLKELSKVHPADIAEFIETLDHEKAIKFFLLFAPPLRLDIFQELSHSVKIDLLENLPIHDRNFIITHLSIDDLTDFLDDLSDDELKKYLQLLHKQDQKKVLSLLKFDSESAGGIMYTSVLTLMQDFTVEKSIQILQRLRPKRELHQQIYVVSQNNELVGHINLEDLVLHPPKTHIRSILRPNIVTVGGNDDREQVAQTMVHYGVSNVPVVDSAMTFLGVIPSEALVEIIEEEAEEDIYRMSALSPIKHTYFETPFFKLLYQRSSILIILLMVQTLSTMIIRYYEAILCGFLTYFISMLTSTGGNASSQTSALVIQGLATGEINDSNSKKFIKREFFMALLIALLLAIFSFVRIVISHQYFLGACSVSISLFFIILTSVTLGSCMPLILRKLNIDPAHSAGPILTTAIDVIGLLLYCIISSVITAQG